MKAAVLKEVRNLVIEDVPEPADVPAGCVRVAVKAVGICGSDVHYYREGAIGSFVLRAPMILGHEVGGIVDAVGAG
ncbi:MAG: alcohol dehydrogenase catalytic domain-containing protein, partial [Alicyclobacillus sp.]|nr:alcohol dehydrogenase catalytic domain-containing protein [Alicyclobacillus sp.]